MRKQLRAVAGKVPGLIPLARRIRSRSRPTSQPPIPAGHFYSPIPDMRDVRARASTLFREDVKDVPAVDVRREAQIALATEMSPLFREFPFTEVSDRFRFRTKNGMFAGGDAVALFAFLRHFRPKRLIEVGSGFSSALMLDTNETYLENHIQFTFIEPYTQRLKSLLRPEDIGRHQLIERPVQEVPLDTFSQLEAGDVLFIDSSHVSKIGSDLNYLLFEVIPSLRGGVLIHIHDVFWPFEYPLKWLELGIFWNENYLIRAFLQYNKEFEVLLFMQYLARQAPEFFKEHLGDCFEDPGQSLWLRRR